jgi:hypothetical protein
VTSIDDFKKDGKVDWDAYHRAEVANGERCRTCGGFILFGNGSPRECRDCQDIADSSDEVSHNDRVRCPKCRHVMNVSDSELWDLYEEGDHDITCRSCDHDFEVNTSVSYTFNSPELIDDSAENES